MSTDPEIQQLLAPMAEREVDTASPAFQVDRERVLARMARAHAQAPVALRSRWPSYTGFAAAAALLLVAGTLLWQRAGSQSGMEVTIAQGSATQLDGELETGAASEARVRTKEGLDIEVHSQTRVGLNELTASSQLKLIGGAVRCTVPHRRPGHPFQVITPDVIVEDIGTIFTVTVDGPKHLTRVSVEEGEVLIRQGAKQIHVRAPNSWSSSDVAEPAVLAPAQPEPAPESSAKPEPLPVKGPRGASKPPGSLAQEAQLLRQGLAAERQGRSAEAAATLKELIRKYPQSPLVPDARAALIRVEAGTRQ